MNCQDVAALLDSHDCSSLPPVHQAKVTDHMFACESCDNAWRAARLLHLLSVQPVLPIREGFFEETMRLATTSAGERPPRVSTRWWEAGACAALAASLLIALVTDLGFVTREDIQDNPSTLSSENREIRNISVAIDSKEAIAGVNIEVILKGDIELDGFAGRNVISWTADLDAGVNRLTLPVSKSDAASGELVVKIEHQGKRRELLVRVGSNDPGATGQIG